MIDGVVVASVGWCSALKLGHHVGWNEMHGLVMYWLLDAYLSWHVEGPNAEGAFDKFVVERWPGYSLNEMNWPRLDDSESFDLAY
jgi:hypothetical protein